MYETSTVNYYTNYSGGYFCTLYLEVDEYHDRLCVIRGYENGYIHDDIVGVRSGNMYNPDVDSYMPRQTNAWAQTVINNYRNSGINYHEERDRNTFPDVVTSPLSNTWIFSGGGIVTSWWPPGGDENYYNLPYDIPVFVIDSQDPSTWSDLNNYISTGDDSGAINYDTLHPSTVEIHMFRDGKEYPNYYIICKGTGGTGFDENGIVSTTNQGFAQYSPALSIDHTYLFTWSELSGGRMSNDIDIFFEPRDHWNGSPYTGDWYVSATISKYGTPAITHNPSGNGQVTLIIHPNPPTEDDYPDDYPTDGDTTDPTQSYTSFGGDNILTKTYYLTSTRVRQLGNFLWSSTFKDNIFSLTQFPLENIVSLKAMPITNSGADEEIKIGNVNTGVYGGSTTNASNYEATIGTLAINRAFNNFLDFTHTKIELYLPYIGIKELPTADVMGKTIKVVYKYDLILGTCLADVMVYNNNMWTTIFIAQGNCGIDIPITSTNRASIENGFINNALSFVGNIAQGNIGGAFGNALSGTTQDFHSQSTGVGNPSLMVALPSTCYAIITRPKKYTPKNYGHYYGYPCYLTKKLSGLEGYTEVENFQTNKINATYDELQLIKHLMETGVYL